MACIPPTLNMVSIPTNRQYKVLHQVIYPQSGGEHNTTLLQPATCAGTASIKMVENSAADPPGMYKPTFPMGSFFANN